jgi:K+-transporting ATPase ATPase C chain
MNMNTNNTPTKAGYVWPSIALTLWFVIGTGIVFPLVIWGIAQAVFPHQANGSMVTNEQGQVIGSENLGQTFTKPEYFHTRPSAAGSGYDAANSSGTNLGPVSDKLINGIEDDPSTPDADESYAGVKQLAAAYRAENGLAADTILPADAVTRSASGLDPHISVANAKLQAQRVATARGVSLDQVMSLINENTDPSFLGVFGEPGVNVLKLNLALDKTTRQ